jgi:hypothetical protein
LEGYVGYETFRRNGVTTNNLIHGGSGSLGVKPTTNLAIEVNAEGDNFAAGSVSGFSYFIIGLGSLTDFRFFIIAIVVFLPPDFASRLPGDFQSSAYLLRLENLRISASGLKRFAQAEVRSTSALGSMVCGGSKVHGSKWLER